MAFTPECNTLYEDKVLAQKLKICRAKNLFIVIHDSSLVLASVSSVIKGHKFKQRLCHGIETSVSVHKPLLGFSNLNNIFFLVLQST